MSTQNYTAEEFFRFLDYVEDKGLGIKNTVASRRSAATRILGLLDEDQTQDLRALDRERAFQIFQNKEGRKYTPQSLNAYRSRFTAALDDFLRYVENPSAFRPQGQGRKAASRGKLATRERDANEFVKDKKLDESGLAVPIPLRDGVIVLVRGLPYDLTSDEVRKINTILAAYAHS